MSSATSGTANNHGIARPAIAIGASAAFGTGVGFLTEFGGTLAYERGNSWRLAGWNAAELGGGMAAAAATSYFIARHTGKKEVAFGLGVASGAATGAAAALAFGRCNPASLALGAAWGAGAGVAGSMFGVGAAIATV